MLIDKDIICLAGLLPCGTEENRLRIEHCRKFGKILKVFHKDELVGYAEVYVMKAPPSYPVIPWPVNDFSGEYLYCYAAACFKGNIKKLWDLAKKEFPSVKYICYHRLKYQNKIHIERL